MAAPFDGDPLSRRRSVLEVLAQALEASATSATITDAHGFFEFANRAFEELSGYCASELVGTHVDALCSEPSVPGGGLLNHESLRHKGGHCYQVSVLTFPVDEHGDPAAHLIRLYEPVCESPASAPAQPESAPFTLVADLGGTILYINRTVPGLDPSTTVGSSIYTYTAPEEHDRLRAYADQVIRTKQAVHYTIRAVGAFGTMATYAVDLGPIELDGEVVALTFATAEVPDASLEETKPRQGDPQLDALPPGTTDAAAIHDRGIILEANAPFAALFGYRLEEIIDMHIGELAAPEHRGLVMGQILDRVEGPYRALAVRKDGAKFDVEIWGKNVTYRGRPARIASLRPIDDRSGRATVRGRPPRSAFGDDLSERELQVLALLAQGLTDRQVADRLGVSRRTTSHHVGSILRKLGVPNRTAAALAARQAGLLPGADPER